MTGAAHEESTLERHLSELATRTLENNPATRDEARSELIVRLTHGRRQRGKAPVEAALYHLAKVVPAKWGMKGILASGVTILFLAALALFQLFVALPEIQLLMVARDDGPSAQRWFDNLPAADREFFSAGKEKGTGNGPYTFRASPTTNQEALETLGQFLQKYPDDPAWYEAYSIDYIAIHSDVPPGFRETWQRIDPGNGMWPCLEAAALTMAPTGTTRKDDDGSQAMRQFEAGASADRFETYQPELRKRKLAMLPPFPGNALAERFQRTHPPSQSTRRLDPSQVRGTFKEQ